MRWVVVLILPLLLTGFSPSVSAAEVPVSNVDSPFDVGTGTRRLSPQEKSDLLQYAENSRALLTQALEEADGKGFDEANRIYLAAAKKVVLLSYASKPRTELLLRYSLNQAMELTFGVPNADGSGVAKRGVLLGAANRDLLTLILEDSIRLAISYYEDDRSAIEKGNLIALPYAKFAAQRLALARKWSVSITEWKFMRDFGAMALQQWLNTALAADNLQQSVYAEEITRVNQALEDLDGNSGLTVQGQVRLLRGLTGRVLSSLSQKIQAQARQEQDARDAEALRIRQAREARERQEREEREEQARKERETEAKRNPPPKVSEPETPPVVSSPWVSVDHCVRTLSAQTSAMEFQARDFCSTHNTAQELNCAVYLAANTSGLFSNVASFCAEHSDAASVQCAYRLSTQTSGLFSSVADFCSGSPSFAALNCVLQESESHLFITAVNVCRSR